MWKDKVARTALIGLFLLYFSALFADILTPYGMEFNDANVGNAPATLLHIHNDNGEFCCPCLSSKQENTYNLSSNILGNKRQSIQSTFSQRREL
jgi:hypothetical protein